MSAEDEPKGEGEAVGTTRQSKPMKRSERWLAGVLGTILTSAGSVAVFVTTNQAGSTALVAAGIALLVIAIQGTHIIKFGGAGAGLELAQAASELVKEAEKAAETDPKRAELLVEAAAIVNPAMVSSRAGQSARYEERLADALRDVASSVNYTAGPGQVDYVVTDAERKKVVVEAKFRHYGPFQLRDVLDAVNQVERHLVNERRVGDYAQAGVLIVTNAALTADVADFNSQDHQGRPIEVISWNGGVDNGLLARALARLAR